jgi:crossover junction endodeoxyribonuclease RuvC
MRILGVDPGLKATGYGLIELCSPDRYQMRLLEAGTIEPKTKEELQNKLQKIYTCLNEIILQYSPDVMVLEKLYSHYRHPTTACLLGHVRGVILLVSAHNKLKAVEHSVKRIRKSLSGNGNASKQQIREVVMHILKIKSDNLTLDASDAIALALGYARMHDVLR